MPRLSKPKAFPDPVFVDEFDPGSLQSGSDCFPQKNACDRERASRSSVISDRARHRLVDALMTQANSRALRQLQRGAHASRFSSSGGGVVLSRHRYDDGWILCSPVRGAVHQLLCHQPKPDNGKVVIERICKPNSRALHDRKAGGIDRR